MPACSLDDVAEATADASTSLSFPILSAWPILSLWSQRETKTHGELRAGRSTTRANKVKQEGVRGP